MKDPEEQQPSSAPEDFNAVETAKRIRKVLSLSTVVCEADQNTFNARVSTILSEVGNGDISSDEAFTRFHGIEQEIETQGAELRKGNLANIAKLEQAKQLETVWFKDLGTATIVSINSDRSPNGVATISLKYDCGYNHNTRSAKDLVAQLAPVSDENRNDYEADKALCIRIGESNSQLATDPDYFEEQVIKLVDWSQLLEVNSVVKARKSLQDVEYDLTDEALIEEVIKLVRTAKKAPKLELLNEFSTKFSKRRQEVLRKKTSYEDIEQAILESLKDNMSLRKMLLKYVDQVLSIRSSEYYNKKDDD